MATTDFVNGTVVQADWLNDVDAVTYQGAQRTETGSAVRTLNFYVQHSKLQVANFCDPTTDTPTQVATALAAAIAAAKAGGKVLEFEPGATYTTNAVTAFLGTASLKGLRFWGNGATIYRSTGVGPVATLDATGTGSRCDDIEFTDFRLRGNASSTYGLYLRGVSRSRIERLRALDVASAGYRIEYAVSTAFRNLYMSNNLDTFALAAALGMSIDDDGLGNYTADCLFDNMVMEGTTAISDCGIELDFTGLANTFRNGTCEGLVRGFRTLSTSRDNVIEGMDFEANTDYDISIAGKGLVLRDVNTSSAGATGTVVVGATAESTTFYGGYHRWVALNASSKSTRFFGTNVDNFATLGITGPTAGSTPAAGIYQAFGVKKTSSGAWVSDALDVCGSAGTWTPTLASTGGGTQGAVTTAVGRYNRVGNVCFITGAITIAKGTLGAGAISITGLPFRSVNVTNVFAYLTAEWSTVTLGANYSDIVVRIAPNSIVAEIIKTGTTVASANINLADLPAPVVLFFSGTYEVA